MARAASPQPPLPVAGPLTQSPRQLRERWLWSRRRLIHLLSSGRNSPAFWLLLISSRNSLIWPIQMTHRRGGGIPLSMGPAPAYWHPVARVLDQLQLFLSRGNAFWARTGATFLPASAISRRGRHLSPSAGDDGIPRAQATGGRRRVFRRRPPPAARFDDAGLRVFQNSRRDDRGRAAAFHPHPHWPGAIGEWCHSSPGGGFDGSPYPFGAQVDPQAGSFLFRTGRRYQDPSGACRRPFR